MKKTKISLIASFAILSSTLMFSGCGSSDDTTTTTTTTPTVQERDVTVVDAYVIGATVTDGQVSSFSNGNGVATAAFDANSIITSTGGTIDTNANGIADANEPEALPMATPAGKDVLSPLTDLVVKGVAEDKLAEVLGVNAADIYTDPIATNNVELAKAMQVVVAVVAGGKTDEFVQSVNTYVAPEAPVTTPTTTTEGDLPTIGQYTDGVTAPVEENTTDINVTSSGDLPAIGQYETTATVEATTTTTEDNATVEVTATAETNTTTTEVTTTTTTTTTTTANITALVTIAQGLFAADSAEAALINAVVNANVENASEVEAAVADAKAALLATPAATEAEAAMDTAEMTAEADMNTTTDIVMEVPEEATTTATEDMTTLGQYETTTTVEATTTTDTAEVETTTTTTTNSDLPTFSY